MGKAERKGGTLRQPATSLFNWRGEKDFVMMKTLLCLTAIFVAIHAAFPFQKDAALSDTKGNSVYRQSTRFQETQKQPVRLSYHERNSMSEESTTSQEDDETEAGPVCDPKLRPPESDDDVVSLKFFDENICVTVYPPPDIVEFCSTFRPDTLHYFVMILNDAEYDTLRTELYRNQSLFYEYRYTFPPLGPEQGQRFFYTYYKYPLVFECDYQNGQWYGTRYNYVYQAFIPRGHERVYPYEIVYPYENVYQIYHGCAPAFERPPDQVGIGSCYYY